MRGGTKEDVGILERTDGAALRDVDVREIETLEIEKPLLLLVVGEELAEPRREVRRVYYKLRVLGKVVAPEALGPPDRLIPSLAAPVGS